MNVGRPLFFLRHNIRRLSTALPKRWIPKETVREALTKDLPKFRALIDSYDVPTQDANRYDYLRYVLPTLNPGNRTEWQEFCRRIPEFSRQETLDRSATAIPVVPKLGTFKPTGPFSLTAKDKKIYEELGLVGPFKTPDISLETVTTLFSTDLDQRKGPMGSQHWISQSVLNVTQAPSIVSKVSSILGPNVIVDVCSKVIKHPNDEMAHFHSDANSLLSRDMSILNIWFGITATDEKRAPLQFLPGTHRLAPGNLFSYLKFILNDLKSNPQDIDHYAKILALQRFDKRGRANHCLDQQMILKTAPPSILDGQRRIVIPTERGETMMFNSHLQHGSVTNTSSQTRVGMAIIYRSATHDRNQVFSGPTHDFSEVYSVQERQAMGMENPQNGSSPIIQVLGQSSAPSYFPVNILALEQVMTEKGLT